MRRDLHARRGGLGLDRLVEKPVELGRRTLLGRRRSGGDLRGRDPLGQNENTTDLLAAAFCIVDIDDDTAAENIAEDAAAHGDGVRAEKHDAGMVALHAGAALQIGGKRRLIRKPAPLADISKQTQSLLDLVTQRVSDRRGVGEVEPACAVTHLADGIGSLRHGHAGEGGDDDGPGIEARPGILDGVVEVAGFDCSEGGSNCGRRLHGTVLRVQSGF